MKKIFLLSIFIMSVGLLAEASSGADGKVIKCHDGDTCRIQIGKEQISARISGIDAPEISQPGGRDAQKFIESIIKGKNIAIECDGKSFNRKVCILKLYGKDVGEEMVKNGWAWDSPKYSKGRYKEFEQEARREKLGIWKSENVVSPYCFRHSSSKKCLKNKSAM